MKNQCWVRRHPNCISDRIFIQKQDIIRTLIDRAMIEPEVSMKKPVELVVEVVASSRCLVVVQLVKLNSVQKIKMLSGLFAMLDVVGQAMRYCGVLHAITTDHTGL